MGGGVEEVHHPDPVCSGRALGADVAIGTGHTHSPPGVRSGQAPAFQKGCSQRLTPLRQALHSREFLQRLSSSMCELRLLTKPIESILAVFIIFVNTHV